MVKGKSVICIGHNDLNYLICAENGNRSWIFTKVWDILGLYLPYDTFPIFPEPIIIIRYIFHIEIENRKQKAGDDLWTLL